MMPNKIAGAAMIDPNLRIRNQSGSRDTPSSGSGSCRSSSTTIFVRLSSSLSESAGMGEILSARQLAGQGPAGDFFEHADGRFLRRHQRPHRDDESLFQ